MKESVWQDMEGKMMKTRKIPGFIKLFIAAYVFVFIGACMFGNVCMASNWQDKLYECTNNVQGVQLTELPTSYESKEDYSSSYGYNDKSNTNITKVLVVGNNNGSNAYVDCTYGNYKDLPIGQAYYFPNYVKERGYDNAGLVMWPAYGDYGMYIHVWWSPDSI